MSKPNLSRETIPLRRKNQIKLIQNFMSKRRWFFYLFLGCLVEEKNNINNLLASMQRLTNSKDRSGSRITISVPASLSVIGRFYL
jgi:hypothetical protein